MQKHNHPIRTTNNHPPTPAVISRLSVRNNAGLALARTATSLVRDAWPEGVGGQRRRRRLPPPILLLDFAPRDRLPSSSDNRRPQAIASKVFVVCRQSEPCRGPAVRSWRHGGRSSVIRCRSFAIGCRFRRERTSSPQSPSSRPLYPVVAWLNCRRARAPAVVRRCQGRIRGGRHEVGNV